MVVGHILTGLDLNGDEAYQVSDMFGLVGIVHLLTTNTICQVFNTMFGGSLSSQINWSHAVVAW